MKNLTRKIIVRDLFSAFAVCEYSNECGKKTNECTSDFSKTCKRFKKLKQRCN